MILSTDYNKLKHHLCITGSPIVAEMILPKLHQHGIKVFNFIRHYADGSFIRLSSDSTWNEHYFLKGYINKRNKVPAEYLVNPINYYIWLTEHWPEMLSDYETNFGIGNGITIAEKHLGYIDFFCFAAKANNKSIINFYINHLDLLQSYGHEFKDKAKLLINEYEKNRIILPNNVIYTGTLERNKSVLTLRERDCGLQLILCNNIKEIAKKLQLSPRTVETHINNMKIKLNCRNQIELVIKLSKLLNLSI